MSIEVAPLLSVGLVNSKAGLLKPGRTGIDFSSIIKASMRSAAWRPSALLLQTALQREGQPGVAIESLRNRLLAAGGTLNSISLGRQDLNLLRGFLQGCGYSREEVESCLEDIAASGPMGGISFAALFDKLDGLGLRHPEPERSITLASAAIPELEMSLRDAGLSLKEIERTIEASRTEGGDLDARRLLGALRNDRLHALSSPLSELIARIESVLSDTGTSLAGIGPRPNLTGAESGPATGRGESWLGLTGVLDDGPGPSGPLTVAAKGPIHQPDLLGSHHIPRLEAILRDSGYALKDIEYALQTARMDGGDLDVRKLLAALQNKAPDPLIAPMPEISGRVEEAFGRPGRTFGATEHPRDLTGLGSGRLDLDRLLTVLEQNGLGRADDVSSQSVSRLVAILRDAGLAEQGIERLLTRLNPTDQGIKGPTIGERPLYAFASRLDGTSKQIPAAGEPSRFSVRSLTTALEQAVGGTDERKPLAPKVKAAIDQILQRAVAAGEWGHADGAKPLAPDVRVAIDQILEKAVVAKQRNAAPVIIPALARHEPASRSLKGKGDQRGPVAGTKRTDWVSAGKAGGGEQPAQDANPARVDERVRLPGQQNAAADNPGTPRGEAADARTETRAIEMPRDGVAPDFTESLQASKQNQKPTRESLPTYVLDQVGKQVARSILRGQDTVSLQLRPPELGTLKLEVEMKGNTLKLGMIAENGSVKEILQSGIPQLREALVDQGVKVERLEIHVDDGANRSLADAGDGPKTDSGEGRRTTQKGGGARVPVRDGGVEDPTGDARMEGDNERMLDLSA